MGGASPWDICMHSVTMRASTQFRVNWLAPLTFQAGDWGTIFRTTKMPFNFRNCQVLWLLVTRQWKKRIKKTLKITSRLLNEAYYKEEEIRLLFHFAAKCYWAQIKKKEKKKTNWSSCKLSLDLSPGASHFLSGRRASRLVWPPLATKLMSAHVISPGRGALSVKK